MKKLVAAVSALGTSLYLFTLPVMAAAQNITLCDTTGKFGSLCALTIDKVIVAGIQAVLVIALLLAFVFLVFGGIKWILSGGDKAGTEAAKGTITAALIGLVIVFMAWVLLSFVTGFFSLGKSGEKFTIPGL